MRRLGVLCLTISAVLVVVALALPASAGGRPLSAEMTGAQEVPGPGDPDGSGTVSFTMNPGRASEHLRWVPVHPAAPGDRWHWIAIMPTEITGRRFNVPPSGTKPA